jgi:ubiquinone biosynthesis protein
MGFVQDIKDINRLREIGAVLADEGFGFLLVKMRMHHIIPLSKRLKAAFSIDKNTSIEARLRKAMVRLGPTFVKFGQALSLRPDLIPESYVKEFEKMQDSVDPFPYAIAEKILEEEYGKPIHAIFSHIEKTPVASASLSQVHAAILKDGAKIALKIQRPNIKEVIATDIDILKKLVDVLGKHMSAPIAQKLQKIIREFEKWIEEELDFTMEANNAEAFRHNFQKDKHIHIPQIYHQYSTRKILAMEFIEGTELNQFKDQGHSKPLITYVDVIYESILKQAFVYGIFHADPHPGNIIIMRDHRVCFIDFGIVGRLDDTLKEHIADIFFGIVKNDSDLVFNAFIRLTKTTPSEECRRELSNLISIVKYNSLRNINVTYLFNKSFSIINKYEIHVPIDLVLFAKMVAMIEGLGLRYHPDFNFVEYSKPFAKKIVQERLTPKAIVTKVKKVSMQYKNFMEDLPEDLHIILDRLKSGQMKIDIEDTDLKNFMVEIEHSSINLSIGLLIASLIIACGFILSNNVGSHLGIGGMIIAGVLLGWLMKRIWFYK